MNPFLREDWYLASLGRTLIWARLRVLEAGTAEVLDSDGNTLPYDSEDSASASSSSRPSNATNSASNNAARLR